VPSAPEEEGLRGRGGAKYLSGSILDQSPAQIDVVGKRLTGTPLSKPLLGDEFGKSPKTKCRNVNRVALASRRSFKEITPAPGTAMLDERIAGLDFYRPAFDPVVAAPRVAIHRKTKLQRQEVYCEKIVNRVSACTRCQLNDKMSQRTSKRFFREHA
jgi:hypothetical protein